jgi:CarD family transcriptional regulator
MTTIESSDLKFTIGDKVVHPQHGVGFVADLEEKQFEPNASRMYYVIAIPDTTLWVPVDLSTSGLRKLGAKSEIDQCRQVLQDPPLALKPGRELMTILNNRIKEGTIVVHCEVVRDLTAYGWSKPLFGPIADFQRMTFTVLCQEWAAVDGTSLAEATHEINNLLKKARASYKS